MKPLPFLHVFFPGTSFLEKDGTLTTQSAASTACAR
jgi:hypothetical protein